MNSFLSNKIFCIIQTNISDCNTIISTIFSVLYQEPEATIVLCVNEKYKKHISHFPCDITKRCDFLVTDIADNDDTPTTYISNIIKTLDYSIDKYGSCLLIPENTIMVNKITISEEVKSQEFSFLKKHYIPHTKEEVCRRFSFDLCYACSNALSEVLREALNDTTFISDKEDISLEEYFSIPSKIIENHDITELLPSYNMISSEDFFSFTDPLKISHINLRTLALDENPISFITLKMNCLSKPIEMLNETLIKIILGFQSSYFQIFALRNKSKKINLGIPNKKKIGIWSRENDVSGLYDVFDFIKKNYNDFCSVNNYSNNYFSIMCSAIYDKPSYEWLHPGIEVYNKVFYCNYDEKALEHFEHLKPPCSFAFYYTDYPYEVIKFREENDIMNKERSNDKLVVSKAIKNGKVRYPATGRRGMKYKTLMRLVSQHDYAIMKKYDMGLFMTLIAVGTVPVLKKMPEGLKLYNLEEGVHYLVGDSIPKDDIDFSKMRENLAEFYNEHLDLDKCFRKLLNQVFIGDVEGFDLESD